MKPKGKKLISLLLVFSLLMLFVNMYAKERRGAELVVTKKDRRITRGELIAVKKSLLLMRWHGIGVSIDIRDVRVIEIKIKSKARSGAFIGALIGSIGGATFMISILHADPDEYLIPTVFSAIIGAGIGALPGALIGVVAGTDKTIQIEGMSDSEIQETLDYLRKKARISAYR